MHNTKVGYKKEKLQKMCSSIMTDKLPRGLKISTMTITGKFKTDFNIANIGRYMDLNYYRIRSKKYNNITYMIDKQGIITKHMTKSKKKDKPNKNFYNQTTIEIISPIKEGKTKVKLFKNGSIQMTGCKGYEHFVDLMQILVTELHKKKAVLDKSGKIKAKYFMNKRENVSIDKFYDFNVNLINSNFDIGYKVNREELYQMFLKQKVECRYEPILHACVNIKYYYKGKKGKKDSNKKISIFVFESGSVIITGACHQDHIKEAHEYICRILYDNYNKLVLISFDKLEKILKL